MGAATISRPMWQGPRSRAGAGSLPNCFTAFSMLSLQRWKPTRSPRQAVQVRFDGGIRIPLPCSTTKPLASVKDSSIPHQRRTVSRILRTICSSPSTLSRCANGPAISPYPNCCCTALAQASATSAIGRVPSMDTTLARVPTSRLYSRSICCICCGVSYRSSLAPRCFTRSSAMEAGTYRNRVRSALRAYRFAAWMKSCDTLVPWYASELRMYRSRMTSSPRARRGSICESRWSRRSAAKSSAMTRSSTTPSLPSACGVAARPARIWRTSRPTGPSLGWCARWTVRPRPRSRSARSCAWVVVPAPSRPSKTMNRPGCALTASPPAEDRSRAPRAPRAAGIAPRPPRGAGRARAGRRRTAASPSPRPAFRTLRSGRPRGTLPARRARTRRPSGARGQPPAAGSARPRAPRCRAAGPSAAVYGARSLASQSVGWRLKGSRVAGSSVADREWHAAFGAARLGGDAREAGGAEHHVDLPRLRVGRREGRGGARIGILLAPAIQLERAGGPVLRRPVRLVRRPLHLQPLLRRPQRARRQRGLLQVGDPLVGRVHGGLQGGLQAVDRRREAGHLGRPAENLSATRAFDRGQRIVGLAHGAGGHRTSLARRARLPQPRRSGPGLDLPAPPVDRVHPLHRLRLLDSLDIQVDHHRFLAAAHQHAFQRLVGRVDLLVRHEGGHEDEVARPRLGQVLEPVAPAHPRPAFHHVDDALQLSVVVRARLRAGMDGHGAGPQLPRPRAGVIDRRGARHAGRLGRVRVQLVGMDDADPVLPPVGHGRRVPQKHVPRRPLTARSFNPCNSPWG